MHKKEHYDAAQAALAQSPGMKFVSYIGKTTSGLVMFRTDADNGPSQEGAKILVRGLILKNRISSAVMTSELTRVLVYRWACERIGKNLPKVDTGRPFYWQDGGIFHVAAQTLQPPHTKSDVNFYILNDEGETPVLSFLHLIS